MFYVVEEGNFTVYDGANEMARVGPGSCFGELALLHGGPRAASVK
jgi:CRP-like cAMP-binding protein